MIKNFVQFGVKNKLEMCFRQNGVIVYTVVDSVELSKAYFSWVNKFRILEKSGIN